MNAWSAFASRYDEKVSHLLSAEKLASLWFQSPLVTCRGVPPSARMTKTWRYPSSLKPTRSARQTSRVRIFGGSTHFAPLGGVGIGMRKSCCRVGTIMVNAMDFPSGAHARLAGDSVRWETCDAEPSASIHRTQICEPPGSPLAMYAMRVPSGAHLTSAPWTSARGREPSAFMIQTDDSQRSFILSTQRRLKMTCLPSG